MLPFSVLRLTLPSIFETVWYNVIPAVFTYTRKPAATFFENKFCPTSEHVRWGGGDSGLEGGQVLPTSEHQTSCSQTDSPLVDCPTGKGLTKAQSPVTTASSVAWALDRGCCFTDLLSPSIQVFLVDFYSPLRLDLNWTLQKIHLRQPEDRAPSRRGENLRPSDQERARRDIGAYQASWWFRRESGEGYWGAGGALRDWTFTLLLERLCRI